MAFQGDREERRQRRAALRRTHPDVGGDPEEFVRLTRSLAARRPAAGGEELRFVRRPRGLSGVAVACRDRWRRWRNPRPRRVL